MAQDTVKVRDSLTTPLLAQAGGNLTIQGNQGIDILALNHPMQIPFVSGRNLSLISDGIISLDARMSSGGSFSLTSVSGRLANMVSKYDPIISADGDVDVAANYTGASLLVEATGNIRFQGDINITGPDTSTLPPGPDTATLSTSSALIMRSGQITLAYGGVNSGSLPTFGTGNVPAGITLGGNVILQPFNGTGGTLTLLATSGNVSTQVISTNGQQQSPYEFDAVFIPTNDAIGGAISLFAIGGSITTGELYSNSFSNSSPAANGGKINLFATGGSITTGKLHANSYSYSGSAGNGGTIRLEAIGGDITTGKLDSYSDSIGSAGNGGAISLFAIGGSITTGGLYSNSYSDSGSAGNGGNISLFAAKDITINGDLKSDSRSDDSDSGSAGNGGAITLSAVNGINITGNLDSNSLCRSGSSGNGGAINLLTTEGSITTDGYLRSYSFSDEGSAGNGANISLFAAKDINIIGDLSSDSHSRFVTGGNGGAISIFAANTIKTDAINSTGAQGGNITISSHAPFALDNRVISSDTFGTGKGGDIQITAPAISLTGGAQISASTHSSGRGGDITLRVSNKAELSGATTNPPKGIYSPGLATISAGNYLGGFIPTGNLPADNSTGNPLPPPTGTIFPSGVFTQTTIGSIGSGGNLRIETGQLSINDGAALATTTFG